MISFKDVVLERLAEAKRPGGLLYDRDKRLNLSAIESHKKAFNAINHIINNLENNDTSSAANLLRTNKSTFIEAYNTSYNFMIDSKIIIDDYNNFILQATKAEIASMRRTYWLRCMTVSMTGLALIFLGVIALSFNLPIPMLKFSTFH